LSEKHFSYPIETEIPVKHMKSLLHFIYRKYIFPQRKQFANVSREITSGEAVLSFTTVDLTGKQDLRVKISSGQPIRLEIVPLDEAVPEARVNGIKQDIIIAVELFEEKVRESTLYFAWREGEEIIPEQTHGGEKKSINRLFLETQILLFVVFIIFGVILFLLVDILVAPLILLAIQFVFVFYSNKIIARSADWHITESSPFIHLLEYHLSLHKNEEIKGKISKDKLALLKKEIYEQVISKKGEIDCDSVHQIFLKYGLECTPEDFTTKKVNVYDLVKRTADKFHFPMPKVVVANTILPNAAASGPSPNRGVVLITTGLLEQLEENEILSVLGHEFGHLKGRDPLLLYGLTGAEFLFRFYVLLKLFPFIFLSYLFLLYFWAVMIVIFFIAKFFEARADLVSAIVVEQPKVLAEALEKIGFKRLLYERVPSYRLQEWVNLDPHPPIYFRVNRLEKLQVPVDIKHPLIQSAKDVINGFRASFRA
jgi:heat shock protein HtpX